MAVVQLLQVFLALKKGGYDFSMLVIVNKIENCFCPKSMARVMWAGIFFPSRESLIHAPAKQRGFSPLQRGKNPFCKGIPLTWLGPLSSLGQDWKYQILLILMTRKKASYKACNMLVTYNG
jgi:hypothetical protein